MSRLYFLVGAAVVAIGTLATGTTRVGSAPASVTNSLGMRFVKVAPGTFYRTELSYRSGALIRLHAVELTRAYQMQTTEVTQAQWQRVMGSLPAQIKDMHIYRGANRPVTWVSYTDVMAFIRKLNAMDSAATYRLPTYAEWEYVAKGSDRSFYYWGNRMNLAHAFFADNSPTKITTYPPPADVARKSPNGLGIYDLWGNAWEWTSTKHSTHPIYRAGMQGTPACAIYHDPSFCFPRDYKLRDPRGVADGRLFRLAGFSVGMRVSSVRGRSARATDPSNVDSTVGFRLVREDGSGGGDRPAPGKKPDPGRVPAGRITWQGPMTVASFPTNFQAGYEGSRKLFVCEAKYYGSYHLGKTAKGFSGCNIGWGGREKSVASFYTIQAPAGTSFKWVAARDGRYPKGAVSGRNKAQDQKVCRILHKGGKHPGKLVPANGTCAIGWGGQELSSRTYEVLVLAQ